MTFETDLKAKAYELVDGRITLEAFSEWYKTAMAESAQRTITITEEITPSLPIEPFTPPPVKINRFKDYESEEPDEDMRAHHLNLLGQGEP